MTTNSPLTADSVIGVASGELDRGIKGATIRSGSVHWNGSSTDSQYSRWFPLQGYWCAMFVSWCAAQAGMLNTLIPKHSLTTDGADWFKRKGTWTSGLSGVRRGDILYMKIGAARGYVNHVGIVESVNANGAYTIEGNTSRSGFAGSQDTGGCVARKLRGPFSTGISIVGYGRPAYTSAPVTSPNIDWTFDLPQTSVGLVADGYWGRMTTAALQKRFGTYVDGEIWGQNSAYKASNPGLTSGWVWSSKPTGSPMIRAMQSWLGTTADGIAGPNTFKALQTRLGRVADGTFWAPSPAIAELQRRINAGTL